jgi:hypothetical protein
VALVKVGVGFELAGLGEGGGDLGAKRRLVGLHREQVVRPLAGDRAGDVGVGGDSVDRDERPLQSIVGAEAFEQQRDGGELAVSGTASAASTRRAVVATAETR